VIDMFASSLCYVYGLSRRRWWRRGILSLVRHLEGGDIHSRTLRRIFTAYHGVDVGMYSYGCFVPENIPAGTTIGRYCSFATGVTIFNTNHPFDRISQHPFFYNPTLKATRGEMIARGRISIGHDVWLGKNALILPRVSQIGNGAVIGAGSVVTRDVPPYAVVAGNPARIIKYRFPPAIQEKIQQSRWWDSPIEELRSRLDEFLEPAASRYGDSSTAHVVG
jgi:virginiamycin A acetyltransferase